jgi:hypothetical protein
VPERGSAVDGQIEFPQQEPIDAADHVPGQVALNSERPRARKRFAAGDGSRLAGREQMRGRGKAKKDTKTCPESAQRSHCQPLFIAPNVVAQYQRSTEGLASCHIVGQAASLPSEYTRERMASWHLALRLSSALVAFEGALLTGELYRR